MRIMIWIFAFLLAFPGSFYSAPSSEVSTIDLEKSIQEFRLENGMTFLLLPRPGAPVVGTNIRFRVGGVDEYVGITGIAHLLEHMAFKGTRHIGTRDYEAEKVFLDEIEHLGLEMRKEAERGIGADPERIREFRERIAELQAEANQYVVKDELWDTYVQNGADDLNATTSKDVTTYFVSLPSNRLELWALIESQRMSEPVFREFYSERDVVAEERRDRTDTNPWGRLYETLISTAFIAHPNRLPVIGWMSDIQNLSLQEMRRFWEIYYAPNNAVAALVGDFSVDEARDLAERYFSSLPAKPNPPEILTVEPEQNGERRATVLFDAEPMVLIGYKRPTFPSRDAHVLDIAHVILTEGRTSRLYRRLIRDDRAAAQVYSFDAPGHRYDNLFVIGAVPMEGTSTVTLEEAIYEELERLASEGPTPEELSRARRRRRVEFVRELESNQGLAGQLTYYQTVAGDWRYLLQYLEEIEEITEDEVREAVARYLAPERRTVATLVRR